MSSRNVALGALLGALAAVIPLAFGFLRVTIPPFTATLASHVPVMLAMFVSPAVALVAGLGSTVGFLLATSLWYVAARAAVHMVWGVLGAYLYRGAMRPWVVLSVILPLHMLGEALVVLPFGFDLYKAFIVVGIGTGLHHLVDMSITLAVLGALVRLGVPLARRPG